MSETALQAPGARPPGPSGHPIFGMLLDFRRDPMNMMERNAAAYGGLVRFHMLGMPVYQVNEPELVRAVLVNAEGAFTKGNVLAGFKPLVGKGLLLNEGESHKRQRRMIAPAFHSAKVRGYGAAMLAEAEALSARWSPGVEVDMAAEMSRVTLEIAARTLFGSGMSAQDSADVAEALAAFALWYHQSTHPLAPLLSLLPTASNRRFKAARARLMAIVDRLIAERRASGDGGDILSRLVFARDVDGDGAAMSEEHLRDEAVTLLIAGHETTAATLAWAWLMLAQHPEVADRLAAEVNEVTGGRAPTVEDLPRLRYAEWVFHETLRLYPSALAMPRQAQKPVVLGGYTLPKGAIVMVSAWCAHRDPRHWEQPDRFNPDRWAPEVAAKRPKYAYFPFSGGARSCVGEGFAVVEGTLVLAALARTWKAALKPGYKPEIESLFTLRPKGGLPMTLSRREAMTPA